jgi:hypothetical protein
LGDETDDSGSYISSKAAIPERSQRRRSFFEQKDSLQSRQFSIKQEDADVALKVI